MTKFFNESGKYDLIFIDIRKYFYSKSTEKYIRTELEQQFFFWTVKSYSIQSRYNAVPQENYRALSWNLNACKSKFQAGDTITNKKVTPNSAKSKLRSKKTVLLNV